VSDLMSPWPALGTIAPSSITPIWAQNAPPQGSPLWWLWRLGRKLDNERSQIHLYDDYYEGKHPLAFASEKFLKAFGGLFEQFADNWCDLVVDALVERLKVQGFRYPTDGGETAADQDAWNIWQANNLDAESQIGIREAVINGRSAAIVWADRSSDIGVEITFEHPSEVFVEMMPGSRRKRAAALKRWTDDDGTVFANVYLPDAIYKYRSRGKGDALVGLRSSTEWVERETQGEPWPLPNPLKVVPVVPFYNRPRMLLPGRSEIHRVIPVQNGVNKLVADMLVASEYAAFRQRWVTGIDIPRDPVTNQPIEEFRPAVDRMFKAKSQDTKFGEFTASELQNFVTGVEMLVQHIASQSRTPPHYFYLKGTFPSGESIKSAETGLVAKTLDRSIFLSESCEETIGLAFLVLDDPRAKVTNAETIWADPESRSEAEHVDAVIKRRAIGVPFEQLWEDVGYTPQQIERMKEMRKLEAADPVLAAEEQFDKGEALNVNA
jgi:hypothetical protein